MQELRNYARIQRWGMDPIKFMPRFIEKSHNEFFEEIDFDIRDEAKGYVNFMITKKIFVTLLRCFSNGLK